MSTRKMLLLYCVIFLVVSIPFTFIHLMANPDDAPISPIQHLVAAMANFAGPWGVVVVRIVDFPNAGLRSFSWILAGGLTLFGVTLIGIPFLVKKRIAQYFSIPIWSLFLIIWFGIGLSQIADGLL